MASSEPIFPKSLYLIQPLFALYELNPVALNAQSSVLVPDGLDLDAWIVPPPPEITLESSKKKVKRSNKGKGKEVDASHIKSGRTRTREENGDLLIPTEAETPEERAERARVCVLST